MVMQWTVNPPTLSRLVRSQYSPPKFGLLVELVKTSACHVEDQGFESPTDRQVLNAPFVYRLGHAPFTGGRGVRFS